MVGEIAGLARTRSWESSFLDLSLRTLSPCWGSAVGRPAPIWGLQRPLWLQVGRTEPGAHGWLAHFGYILSLRESDHPGIESTDHGDGDGLVFGRASWARARDTNKSGVCHRVGPVTLGGWEVPVRRQEQITLLETRPGQFLPCYIIKFVIFILILSSSE